MKRTYSKLNHANKIVYEQINTIDTLRRIMQVQTNQIIILNQRKEEDSEYITRLHHRVQISRKCSNKFYQKWIKESKRKIKHYNFFIGLGVFNILAVFYYIAISI